MIDDRNKKEEEENDAIQRKESFLAPEINSENLTNKSDIYSIGKMIYFILNEEYPVENISQDLKLKENSMSIQKLYKMCINENANERPSTKEIIKMFIEIAIEKNIILEDIDPEYQKEMGDIYYNGEMIPQDIKKMTTYYSFASKRSQKYIHEAINCLTQLSSNTEALQILYSIFYEGKYLPSDIKSYKKSDLITAGNFGKLFKYKNKEEDKIIVAKIFYVRFNDYSRKDRIKIMIDMSIALQLTYPSICKYFVFYPYGTNNDEDDGRPIIFSEYCANGSLYDIIDKERNKIKVKDWNETKKLINVYGIALAMSYLHSHDILHQNLTTKNILEDENFYPKITNYFVSNKNFHSLESLAKVIDYSPFQPPEIYTSNKYTKESEVYSFGMIVYSIYSNKHPSDELTDFQIVTKTVEGIDVKLDDSVPKAIQELVKNCLLKNPKERPTFSEIVEKMHNKKEFVSDSIDINEFNEYIKYTISFPSNNYAIKSMPESFVKKMLQKELGKNENKKPNESKKDETKPETNEEGQQKQSGTSKKIENKTKDKAGDSSDDDDYDEEEEENDDENDVDVDYSQHEEEEEEEEEKVEVEEDEYEDETKSDTVNPFHALKSTPIIRLRVLQQLKKIGYGGFANIYKVRNKETRVKFAAKVVNNGNKSEIINNPVDNMFVREVICHSAVQHETISKFIGYSIHYFHKPDQPAYYLEYLPNGSLQKILDEQKVHLNDTTKLIILYGVAYSMSVLHSKGYIHRDLTCSNVLLNKFYFPKLCDFGLALNVSKGEVVEKRQGTAQFVAPEIINENIYIKEGDVYSFAILAYMLLSETDPYYGFIDSQIFYSVGYKQERPDRNKRIKQIYWDLIIRCWQSEFDKRPTFDDIVKDLGTNDKYITEEVDKNMFESYKNFIQKQTPLPENILKQNERKAIQKSKK